MTECQMKIWMKIKTRQKLGIQTVFQVLTDRATERVLAFVSMAGWFFLLHQIIFRIFFM